MRSRAATNGMHTVNTLPPSAAFAAAMVPPWVPRKWELNSGTRADALQSGSEQNGAVGEALRRSVFQCTNAQPNGQT